MSPVGDSPDPLGMLPLKDRLHVPWAVFFYNSKMAPKYSVLICLGGSVCTATGSRSTLHSSRVYFLPTGRLMVQVTHTSGFWSCTSDGAVYLASEPLPGTLCTPVMMAGPQPQCSLTQQRARFLLRRLENLYFCIQHATSTIKLISRWFIF